MAKLKAKYDVYNRRGDVTLSRAFTAGKVYEWKRASRGDWQAINDGGGVHLGSVEWLKRAFAKV